MESYYYINELEIELVAEATQRLDLAQGRVFARGASAAIKERSAPENFSPALQP
jgi:hypothetical protein